METDSSTLNAGFVFGGALILGLVLIVLIRLYRAFLFICRPNEMLVISGKTRTAATGDKTNFAVIRAGTHWRVPFIQTVYRMDVGLMPTELSVTKALSAGGIPLDVHAIANVKVTTRPAIVYNAVERFLNVPPETIRQTVALTLAGALREVISQLTPEQVNEDRIEFANKVAREHQRRLQQDGAAPRHAQDSAGRRRGAVPGERRAHPDRECGARRRERRGSGGAGGARRKRRPRVRPRSWRRRRRRSASSGSATSCARWSASSKARRSSVERETTRRRRAGPGRGRAGASDAAPGARDQAPHRGGGAPGRGAARRGRADRRRRGRAASRARRGVGRGRSGSMGEALAAARSRMRGRSSCSPSSTSWSRSAPSEVKGISIGQIAAHRQRRRPVAGGARGQLSAGGRCGVRVAQDS